MMNIRFLTFVRHYWQVAAAFFAVLTFESYNLTVAAFWGDEASTINASTRSLGSLLTLVRHVDAVHMVYYFGMHFWLMIFGTSELAVRLPEAIAASVAAVFVFVILRKRTDTISAVVATTFFAMMPRVIWAAGIGRSYAFTILSGIIVTWIFLRILESQTNKKIWFIAYAAMAALACNLFIYSALMLATHWLALLVLRSGFAKLWRFTVAVAIAMLASLPVGLMAQRQMYQIAWIPPQTTNWGERIFGSVLFDSDVILTTFAWSTIALGILIMLIKINASGKISSRPLSNLVITALMVSLLPTTAVYVYSLLNKPIFSGRYFSFSAGLVALLMGVAVYQIRFNLLRAIAFVLIVSTSIGSATFWRQEFRFGNDNNKVAAFVQSNAVLGDAVFFVPNNRFCTGVCTAGVGYARQFKNFTVIGLKNEMIKLGVLHDTYRSPSQTGLQARHFKRIWVIQNSPGKPKMAAAYFNQLSNLGFKPSVSKQLKFETITLYQR